MAITLMALQTLVVVVAALLVAAGGALLVAPQWALSRAAAWLVPDASARGAGISLERVFYRHHRPIGTVIVLGAVYILYFLVFHFSPAAVSDLLLAGLPIGTLKPMLVQLTQLLLFFGALLAFAVGLLLAVRPSALKPVESLAHRPLAVPGWQRLLTHATYGRVAGAMLMALGLGLWWLAGPR